MTYHSVPIRTKKVNQPKCPTDYPLCVTNTSSFDVTVENRSRTGALPVYVSIWGLPPGKELYIDKVYDDDCDPLFTPLMVCSHCAFLTNIRSDIVLTMPGKYHFHLADYESLDFDGDFAYQATPVSADYAQLWLMQNPCCC
jgi:hypothetical protein